MLIIRKTSNSGATTLVSWILVQGSAHWSVSPTASRGKHLYSIPRMQHCCCEQFKWPSARTVSAAPHQKISDSAGWCKANIQRCHCVEQGGGKAHCPPLSLLSNANDSPNLMYILISWRAHFKIQTDSADVGWGLTVCTSNKLLGLCCWPADCQARDHLGQASLSCKGQTVNTLGFGDHMVSITTTQLCCCSTKTATENM